MGLHFRRVRRGSLEASRDSPICTHLIDLTMHLELKRCNNGTHLVDPRAELLLAMLVQSSTPASVSIPREEVHSLTLRAGDFHDAFFGPHEQVQ